MAAPAPRRRRRRGRCRRRPVWPDAGLCAAGQGRLAGAAHDLGLPAQDAPRLYHDRLRRADDARILCLARRRLPVDRRARRAALVDRLSQPAAHVLRGRPVVARRGRCVRFALPPAARRRRHRCGRRRRHSRRSVRLRQPRRPLSRPAVAAGGGLCAVGCGRPTGVARHSAERVRTVAAPRRPARLHAAAGDRRRPAREPVRRVLAGLWRAFNLVGAGDLVGARARRHARAGRIEPDRRAADAPDAGDAVEIAAQCRPHRARRQ